MNPAGRHLAARFPLGNAISLEDLRQDPYPILAGLREKEPVSYVSALNLYFITGYEDVCAILQDTESYIVGTEHSLVFDIFGEHMMTVEGEKHQRFKSAHQKFFLPPTIRENVEPPILAHTDNLIDNFVNDGEVELRSNFSSRLPVLTMLSLFGLNLDEEKPLRAMYDEFGQALANFTWDQDTRDRGRSSARAFPALIQTYLDRLASEDCPAMSGALLATLAGAPAEIRLTDEEIRHNAIIIFFGGISTVDALLLNTLYALSANTTALEEVRNDHSLLPRAINETIRWLGPVQSATRHVVRNTELRGVRFNPGDTVNCMLAAANRDPAMFENPDTFDIHRKNAQRHVGFAVGPHHCLGSHLARAEARIAIKRLFERLPSLCLDLERTDGPAGYEFRQPTRTIAQWNTKSAR